MRLFLRCKLASKECCKAPTQNAHGICDSCSGPTGTVDRKGRELPAQHPSHAEWNRRPVHCGHGVAVLAGLLRAEWKIGSRHDAQFEVVDTGGLSVALIMNLRPNMCFNMQATWGVGAWQHRCALTGK